MWFTNKIFFQLGIAPQLRIRGAYRHMDEQESAESRTRGLEIQGIRWMFEDLH
ncbi:MAG: hypothetical protein WCE94_00840 [Candidatus Methanoperedens sp.]